jgi:hypothetical protein
MIGGFASLNGLSDAMFGGSPIILAPIPGFTVCLRRKYFFVLLTIHCHVEEDHASAARQLEPTHFGLLNVVRKLSYLGSWPLH